MRTTLNLDDEVLRALRRRQRSEGKPLGQLASELLAQAMSAEPPAAAPFRWSGRPMHAKVDLDDKEALRRVLDES